LNKQYKDVEAATKNLEGKLYTRDDLCSLLHGTAPSISSTIHLKKVDLNFLSAGV